MACEDETRSHKEFKARVERELAIIRESMTDLIAHREACDDKHQRSSQQADMITASNLALTNTLNTFIQRVDTVCRELDIDNGAPDIKLIRQSRITIAFLAVVFKVVVAVSLGLIAIVHAVEFFKGM